MVRRFPLAPGVRRCGANSALGQRRQPNKPIDTDAQELLCAARTHLLRASHLQR